MSSSGYATSSALFFLFLAVFAAKVSFCFSTKVYVVYMGSKSGEHPDDILKENHQILASVHSGSIEEAQASHIYTYKHGFRGFAAKLSDEQASQISSMSGEVSCCYIFFPFSQLLNFNLRTCLNNDLICDLCVQI
ncbi:Subtilisin-like protease SBT3.9 [Glycine max]|nr:Subtilisin-like protease SBT3.9 [Glycine max]